MPFRVDMPTFAGGEIGPDLAARVDTAKYKTALRKARNMLAMVGGGVYMRPGLRFAGATVSAAYNAKQVPFQFSQTQGYSLVFGHQNMRVIYDGGYVLNPELTIQGITNANPARVSCKAHGWVVGDDVYFTGQEGMVEINGELGRVLAVIDANTVTVNLDTTAFGVWIGQTGGILGDALGATGGKAPPPPPPAVGTPVPPVPPWQPYVLPPFTFTGFNGFFF